MQRDAASTAANEEASDPAVLMVGGASSTEWLEEEDESPPSPGLSKGPDRGGDPVDRSAWLTGELCCSEDAIVPDRNRPSPRDTTGVPWHGPRRAVLESMG